MGNVRVFVNEDNSLKNGTVLTPLDFTLHNKLLVFVTMGRSMMPKELISLINMEAVPYMHEFNLKCCAGAMKCMSYSY